MPSTGSCGHHLPKYWSSVGVFAIRLRKLFDLHATNKSQIAEKALYYIAAFYEVEREIRELGPGDRQRIRREKSSANHRRTSYLDDRPEAACAGGVGHRQSLGLQPQTLDSANALSR